eukprot:CAMPEP_0204348304 /NCGR_PEP_ID=MMETSP0469-20131031/28615_1 /ASSEMBLY_ACC=CAM_ASM_000384 /TAXON_ID=2969 /ORGANISM="Oxyrrhis marina" /LENGTH=109 /DNA_ID=CAMNT_0051334245 /DNA_START=151 /DNA_END=477 /DNA_ORIENTATION=+
MIWEHSQELFDDLKKLNGIHLQIQWEEVFFEENEQLPFLDVLVERDKDSPFTTTTVYRKPTHHPVKDKLSGIRTLVYRATHYYSTASLKMAELAHLRLLLTTSIQSSFW